MKSEECNQKNPLTVAIPCGNVDESLVNAIASLGLKAIVLKPDDTQIASLARETGLQIYFHLVLPEEIAKMSPFVSNYRERLSAFLDPYKLDGVYWESPYFLNDFSQDLLRFSKLRIELFLEEVGVLETLTSRFLYAVPEAPSHLHQFLPHQFDALSQYTLPRSPVVFSVYDGSSDADHCAVSPFWTTENKNRIPLLSLDRGDAPFYLVEQARRFCLKPLLGACFKMSNPCNGTVYANLKMCIDAMCKQIEPEYSLVDWFRSKRPDVEMDRHWLNEISPCVFKYAFFRAVQNNPPNSGLEDLKSHVEEYLVMQKRLEKHLKLAQKKEHLHSKKLRFFKEIESVLQATRLAAKQAFIRHQISLPNALQED